MENREVVIVDGTRTAFGKMGGTIRPFTAVELATKTIVGLLEKTEILKKTKVDAVFAGSASGDLNTHNFARYACLGAGLPYETSATFIEMQCGSSIACINNAALQIRAGMLDVAICGGAESHSQTYYKFTASPVPFKKIPPTAAPTRLSPVDEDDISMIEVSDLMAKKWAIKREDCDAFAVRSQARALDAIEKGYFKDEIVPIDVKYSRKGETITFDTDEHPRAGTTLESISKLNPVIENGVTTPGNSSGLNDGAAFVLMMSADKAKELGYKPLARWVYGVDVGVDPKLMGIGPVYSSLKAFEKTGIKLSDIDVFECNEAFAAQNLSVIKQLEESTGEKIDMEKWNPNGGAIAFGHPNGASGGRICLATMSELKRKNGKYGLFTSCCGGGIGVTTIIENISEQ